MFNTGLGYFCFRCKRKVAGAIIHAVHQDVKDLPAFWLAEFDPANSQKGILKIQKKTLKFPAFVGANVHLHVMGFLRA